MSEEKMLEMINATADIIFMAVLRGRVSFEACKKSQEVKIINFVSVKE